MTENNDDETTTMVVTKGILKWLDGLKVADEEPYYKVLIRIRDGSIKKW